MANLMMSKTHIVEAPPPTNPYIIPSIYSIELSRDQQVEWVWTQLPDGNRVVTGYKIISLSGSFYEASGSESVKN